MEEERGMDSKWILNSPVHGAQSAGQRRVTDVDVSLDGQDQRQPHGRCVEILRYDLVHETVGVAGSRLVHRTPVIAESVEVKVPRGRENQCQHVR